MTKKHFIALADALKVVRPEMDEEKAIAEGSTELFRPFREGRRDQWRLTLHELADFCASQNSRFDRERWLAYINGECGPNGGKV
ncbi:MAG: hypothetical protein GY906_22610 [bacterium]|nr:hypothetical protein [bacterium]